MEGSLGMLMLLLILIIGLGILITGSFIEAQLLDDDFFAKFGILMIIFLIPCIIGAFLIVIIPYETNTYTEKEYDVEKMFTDLSKKDNIRISTKYLEEDETEKYIIETKRIMVGTKYKYYIEKEKEVNPFEQYKK